MLSSDLVATLRTVSTGTITTILLKKGLRRTWMLGPKPIKEGYPRLVGGAFTMRFVPAREDLATPESWASPPTRWRGPGSCVRSGSPAVE